MTKAAAVNALRPPGTAEEAGGEHTRPLGPKGSVPPEGESRQTCLSQFPTSLPVRGLRTFKGTALLGTQDVPTEKYAEKKR